MCSAKICVNPHRVSKTPGNVFAFKLIEYLGAGAHVVTTPMGVLEPEIEAGVTYIGHRFEQTAQRAVEQTYGAEAVATLGRLVAQVVNSRDIGHQRPGL